MVDLHNELSCFVSKNSRFAWDFDLISYMFDNGYVTVVHFDLISCG